MRPSSVSAAQSFSMSSYVSGGLMPFLSRRSRRSQK